MDNNELNNEKDNKEVENEPASNEKPEITENNVSDNTTIPKKSSITPSYMKTNSNNNSNTEQNIKNEKKINKEGKINKDLNNKKPFKSSFPFKSKLSVIIISLIAIIVLTAIIFIGNKIYLTNKYKGYEKYKEKMDIYGFSRLYDNESAASLEKVTKSEAIKEIIAATLNIDDISGIASLPNKNYENEEWVKYAVNIGIISEEDVNENNQSKKATMLDCLTYLYNAKLKLLNLQTDVEGDPTFSNFNKFSNEQQLMLKDMVWNKIIDNSNSKLNGNKKVFKADLNQLIIKFCEKYNTITEGESKLIINEQKLPSNYLDFPYCVTDIDTKVYEYRYLYSDVSKFKKPYEIYADNKTNFYSISSRLRQYFNYILNVNYNTISESDFKEVINKVSLYKNVTTDAVITKYINYVKDNHIIINGTAKLNFPIFYFDGTNYRLRCSVAYTITNSDTMENCIFGDDLYYSTNYQYDKNLNSICIDIPLNRRENNSSLYLNVSSINDWKTGNSVK